jgi:predicted GH43/DUF377 family glycosyl hydrolase
MKERMKKPKTIVIVLGLVFLGFFVVSNENFVDNAEGAFLTGWDYRKYHNLTATVGAGTNHQVKIRTHYGSGTDSGEDVYLDSKSNFDFSDVRFTDNDETTLLDYWNESEKVYDSLYVDNFLKNNNNPILEGTEAWETFGIRDPSLMVNATGYVVQESGEYIMFYNGINESGGWPMVGRANGTDETTWVKSGTNPVFSDGSYAVAGSVIKNGTNDYIMYYCQGTTVGFNYATSTDGMTWTKNTNDPVPPILDPGDSAQIDNMNLPYVVRIGSTWYMTFEAGLAGTWKLFLASSADGKTWTVSNGGNPIYTGTTGDWDELAQANPSLYELDTNQYVIIYNGEYALNFWDLGVLYSTSLTGTWQSWDGNPILFKNGTGAWDDTRIEGGRLFMDDLDTATLRMWYFGLPGADSFQNGKIGYATCDLVYDFWVEVADDLSSNQQIYVYYGNAVATSASNITNTMIFSDDGMDYDLTYNKSGSSSYSHSTNQLVISGGDSNDDGWVMGADLDSVTTFYSNAKSMHGGSSGSGDFYNAFGLYDFAFIPDPMNSAAWATQRRFYAHRFDPGNGAEPDEFRIAYLDAGDTLHYWDGSAWQLAITYFGGGGNYNVEIWDDGTNYKMDIKNMNGTSLFTSVASIAKANVKSFSDGRVLVSAEPFTNAYFQNTNIDNWYVREYPDITHGAWGEEEGSNTAPTIDNCPTDPINVRVPFPFTYDFEASDVDGDTLTWSITVGDSWWEIDSSSGIATGTQRIIGTYTWTVQVDDGTAQDTCSITLNLLEEYTKGKQPDLKFEWSCTQLDYKHLDCYLITAYGIPFDRLNITWVFGENSDTYYGWRVVHTFEDGFSIGQQIKVTITIEPTNKTASPKSDTKLIESNHIPFWFWLLIIFIIILGFIIYVLSKQPKERKRGPKRKRNKHPTIKKILKSVGWTGLLLLGIAFIWLPTGTPDDLVTTLPLILILGFSLWFIIGVIIVILCLIFLFKFIKKAWK